MAIETSIPSEYYDDNYIPGTTNILTGQQNELNSITSTKSIKRDKNGLVLIPQPTDSPNDPLNWSNVRKYWNYFLLIFYTALTAATSNDAGATQDSLNERYGISYDAMNTGAGVLFASIGVAAYLLSPAPDLYGRKIAYLLCLLVGLVGCIWFAVSRRTSDTIWSQLFVGSSEAAAESLVLLSITDLFFQNQLGFHMFLYIFSTSVGTFLGPLIAGYIAHYQSFRWVGWWGAIICGATLVIFIFFYEETSFERYLYAKVYDSTSIDGDYDVTNDKDIIVKEDDDKKSTIDTKIYNEAEPHQHPVSSNRELADIKTNEMFNIDPETKEEKPRPYYKSIALITPASFLVGTGFKQYLKRLWLYLKVFRFEIVVWSGLMWGFQDVLLSFYLTTEETIFYDPPYNYSDFGVANLNIATLVGSIIGCFLAGYVSDYYVSWIAKRNGGLYEPEYRLYLLFITLILSPAGLIMFGVGSDKQWSPVCIYAGLAFVGFGFGSVGELALSYTVDCYPEITIISMVIVALINNLLACVFTFVCSLWLDASGTTNTYIALAVIEFALIALIIPLIYYGKRIRQKSKKNYIELIELLNGLK